MAPVSLLDQEPLLKPGRFKVPPAKVLVVGAGVAGLAAIGAAG
ncbi:MAG: hypothetical protein AB7V44_11250 [Pseudonocardia sp.]